MSFLPTNFQIGKEIKSFERLRTTFDFSHKMLILCFITIYFMFEPTLKGRFQ